LLEVVEDLVLVLVLVAAVGLVGRQHLLGKTCQRDL